MAISKISAVFQGNLQTVWDAVTSLDHYQWRSDLSQIEVINEKQFIEYTKDGYATTFTITVQTGGTLNGMFLSEKLFDYVDIVVAPLLVGGKDTTTLIDGESIRTSEQLSELGVLELESVQLLHNSYIRLRYKVIS